MTPRFLLMTALLGLAGLPWATLGGVSNLLDFGGVPDGKTYNTEAFQKAIDKASADGGGEVLIPRGEWLTRRIELRSNITIRLAEGARLLAPPSPADYQGAKHLLRASDVHNVTVLGPGEIDGRAEDVPSNPFWFCGKKAGLHYEKRPETKAAMLCFLYFRNCRNIRLEGFAIRHSPAWTILVERCEGVVCKDLRIDNSVFGPNTDGLDIVGSRDVLVQGCDIRTCDDAIVLKATAEDMVCENVLVAGCRLRSPSYGFKVGTESRGVFKNIRVECCTVEAPDSRGVRGGISLQSVDGAELSGVQIIGIDISGARSPIFLRLGSRLKFGAASVGSLRNVWIEDVKAIAPNDRDWSPAIAGVPGHAIENVLLRNIDLAVQGGKPAEQALRQVEEVESGYPDSDMFGPLPSYGFFLRHVRGLAMDNVRVQCLAEDGRPAIVCDDVAGLAIERFVASPKRLAGAMQVQWRNNPSPAIIAQRYDSGIGAFLLATEEVAVGDVFHPFQVTVAPRGLP